MAWEPEGSSSEDGKVQLDPGDAKVQLGNAMPFCSSYHGEPNWRLR